MKRLLFLVILVALILLNLSCQKAEEFTLSKYFQAVKSNDTDTMSAMAAEPISLEAKSWKLISTAEPQIGDPILPTLLKDFKDVDSKRKEQAIIANDKRDVKKNIEDQLKTARGGKKAQLQKQLETADSEFKVEFDKFILLNEQAKSLKTQIEKEKNLIKLSTGIDQNQDTFEGKAHNIKSLVKVTSGSGEKDYVFLLRKYEFVNPLTQKTLPSRLIIVKIQSKEEFDKEQGT